MNSSRNRVCVQYDSFFSFFFFLKSVTNFSIALVTESTLSIRAMINRNSFMDIELLLFYFLVDL